MANDKTCVGCIHYEKNGIQRGQRAYSACHVYGVPKLAMEERKDGECGPEATLKEST